MIARRRRLPRGPCLPLALLLVACGPNSPFAPGDRPDASGSGDPCEDVVVTNPCTEAVPSEDGSACSVVPVATGTGCDDGDPCTTQTACSVLGLCAGAPTGCDDGNVCTVDQCKAGQGCSHDFQAGAACDDGDPCTEDDQCDIAASACVGGADICASCDVDAPDDCDASFTPDNLCDGTVSCQAGKCGLVIDSVTPPCDTSNDNGCRQTGCHPATGDCLAVLAPADTPCEDGDPCTVDDLCDADGECVAGPPPECDDGDDCTEDVCDGSLLLRGCVNVTTCPCTSDADCAQPPIGCLAAVCVEDRCEFEILEDGSRECDGDACTEGDICGAGICTPGAPKTCSDDGDPCTAPVCSPETGDCSASPVPGGECDDDDACTADDVCGDDGSCGGEPLDCADDHDCTVDSCDAQTGCAHSPDDTACDEPGECESVTCQVGSGCVVQPKEGPCTDDGDPCTEGGTCSDGACKGGLLKSECDDANPCTADACDSATGLCTNEVSEGAACDDSSACTESDACDAAGQCVGELVDCGDQHDCTVDSCDPATGCQNTPDDAACPDSSSCLVGVCDAETGCGVTALSDVPCSLEDPCEIDGGCIAGVCTGQPKDCDDGDPCTTESCAPEVGCQYGPICTDGLSCTDDVCDGGDCSFVSAECEDGDDCTGTGCAEPDGCMFEALTGTPCEDGSECTAGDVCEGGECLGGPFEGCQQGFTGPCLEAGCNPDGVTCYAIFLDDLTCPLPAACSGAFDGCSAGLCTSDLSDLAVGDDHACARCPAGEVYCWGSATGAGASGGEQLLAPPVGLSFNQNIGGIPSVGGGSGFGCALADWQQYHCWGVNDLSQLGRGVGGAVALPAPVSLEPFAEEGGALVVGSASACILPSLEHDEPLCWGSNAGGELDPASAGKSPTLTVPTPVAMSPACIGHGFACGHGPGGASCWGTEYEAEPGLPNGVLGDGPGETGPALAAVQGLETGANAFACGEHHACAVHGGENAVSCWGYNPDGRLAVGSETATVDTAMAVELAGGDSLVGVRTVSAGRSHTCAALMDCSTVVCWGANEFGQVTGTPGPTVDVATPVQLPPALQGPSITHVAAGGDTTCVAFAGGQVWCFGSNSSGQLGVSGAGESSAVHDLGAVCSVPAAIDP